MWRNLLEWQTIRGFQSCRKRFFNLVDVTDCQVFEQTSFSLSWYSQKFHGLNGRTVWINEPYKCGVYSYNVIFEKALPEMLQSGEYVVADFGHTLWKCVKLKTVNPNDWKLHQCVRPGPEKLNELMKNFHTLSHILRHLWYKHAACLYAVGKLQSRCWKHRSSIWVEV